MMAALYFPEPSKTKRLALFVLLGLAVSVIVFNNNNNSTRTSVPENYFEKELYELEPTFQQELDRLKVSSNSITDPSKENKVITNESTLESAVGQLEESQATTTTSSIKVNFPIFVTSLFKSGTTTIHDYFRCGGQRSVHFGAAVTTGRGNLTKFARTGPCIKSNIQKHKPMFQGCADAADIWCDNAALNCKGDSCFEPSIHGGLENLYQYYPKATILMAVRDSYQWLDSVKRYKFKNWGLLSCLQGCEGPGYFTNWVGKNVTEEDIRQLYLYQVNHVRQFAKEHPSLTYIEVSLESDDTGRVLEEATGISSDCWGHSNVNKRVQSEGGAT